MWGSLWLYLQLRLLMVHFHMHVYTMFVAGGRCLSSAANPKAKILCGTSSKNSVRVAKLPNFKELIQMSKSRIEIQAFAMKSTPDILCFFQCEPVGGHENAQESREEQTLEKQSAPETSGISTNYKHVFKRWGRSGVVLGSCGIILERARSVFFRWAIRISKSQRAYIIKILRKWPKFESYK
jgi:hypothetical protein